MRVIGQLPVGETGDFQVILSLDIAAETLAPVVVVAVAAHHRVTDM